jgi:hypothetical protein
VRLIPRPYSSKPFGIDALRARPPKAMSSADISTRGVARPRALSAELRTELNLPVVVRAPYPWVFACLVVATACLPLVLAAMWKAAAFAVISGLVLIPAARWIVAREASWREEVYRTGVEVTGRVLDVEPAGAAWRDHLVRVEFFTGGALIRASVLGCPLAQRGLRPGDHVAIIYDEKSPTRCLVVQKVEPEIVDAIFDD